MPLPPATIRTQVPLPLRFSDGYATLARVFSFDGLADGQEHACGSFGLPIAKSTSSHHFRVLREAGIVQQRIDGKRRLNRLRAEQLEQRFPGLLDAVLRANEA